MKRMMSILAAAVVTTWAGVAAQSGNSSGQDKKMDGMAPMGTMDATYTGCIEADGAGGFTLAHAVAAAGTMTAESMKGPSSMKKSDVATDTMDTHAMPSMTLTLTSTTVALGAHVGHKVSVTGPLTPKMAPAGTTEMPNERATLAVTSLRTVSGSCS